MTHAGLVKWTMEDGSTATRRRATLHCRILVGKDTGYERRKAETKPEMTVTKDQLVRH